MEWYHLLCWMFAIAEKLIRTFLLTMWDICAFGVTVTAWCHFILEEINYLLLCCFTFAWHTSHSFPLESKISVNHVVALMSHTVLRDFRVYSPGWTCLKETLFSLVSFYWTKSHYWWHDASTFLLHLDATQTRLRFSYKLTSVYPNSSFAVHHVFYHYFIRFINSSLSSPAFVQLATLLIYHLSALMYVISLQVYRLCSFSFSSLTLSPICYFGNKNTSTLALQSRI